MNCFFQPSLGGSEKIEEDFTLARLYISKMKSEVKTLVTRLQSIETCQDETSKKLAQAEKELSDCKLIIQQVRVCAGYQSVLFHEEIRVFKHLLVS